MADAMRARDTIQAQLVRSAKYRRPETGVTPAGEPGWRTRDWALFVFFRILSNAEIAAMDRHLAERPPDAAPARGLFVAQRERPPVEPGTTPQIDAFRRWLQLLTKVPTKVPAGGFKGAALKLAEQVRKATPAANGSDAHGLAEWALGALKDGNLAAVIAGLREKIADTQPGFLAQPLVRLLLHEFLRQIDAALAPVRAAGPSDATAVATEPPINIAFTLRGLEMLGVDPTTIESFPEPFRAGMAARARRLRDLGASAPENWDGELGLQNVHGYVECGSDISDGRTLSEDFWAGVRAGVRAFNDRDPSRGAAIRELLALAFGLLGMEVVHIEIGQDPYAVREGKAVPLPHRIEHFGFRDGLSQPFLDLGLDAPPEGGGTPQRRRGWDPVAPGEIFLGQADENGDRHQLPVNGTLREGSTFLVFRKLEQDVVGLRAFLARERPGDTGAQAALAASLVGRWPGGMPLVCAPESERDPAGETGAINDFRYAADDPEGRKCPLGAHIRRANPRDIGGGRVRRHRILRRGISYGGPLLPDGANGDGEPRGLLFIAANARIDLQFEVIQAEWLNGGEFLGQAGLGRCPLTGDHDGRPADTFLEAEAVAPITGLPRFVTTRGGDYFFLPGIPALEGFAIGETFPPDESEASLAAFPAGGRHLLSPARLLEYAGRMLPRTGTLPVTETVVRVSMPQPSAGDAVAFVGGYDQVREVLTDPDFSVQPYRSASRRMLYGKDLLIATEPGVATGVTHTRLTKILKGAWAGLDTGLQETTKCGAQDFIQATARARLASALQRTSTARHVDLVDDLAARAAYAVVERVYGVPGPAALTELAMALPFSRKQVGELPADWLAAQGSERPADPALTSMQLWATITVADLIGNVQSAGLLRDLSRKAAAELFSHIHAVLDRARLAASTRSPKHSQKPSTTLVDAFIAQAAAFTSCYEKAARDGAERRRLYYDDVALLLFELVGSTLGVIPSTFASAMIKLLEYRVDLPVLIGGTPPINRETAARRLIFEAERLNPTAAIRMRQCEKTHFLGHDGIMGDDLAVTLIGAANIDPRTWGTDPTRISLGPDLEPGAPARDVDSYLLFGAWPKQGEKWGKHCWGRDLVAMPVLAECLLATAQLQGLRRVAGPGGAPRKVAEIVVGLPARFTRLLPRTAAEDDRPNDGGQPAPGTP